jgi:hypothetical protein
MNNIIIIKCLNLYCMIKAESYDMKINTMIFYALRPNRTISLIYLEFFMRLMNEYIFFVKFNLGIERSAKEV